MIDIQPIERVDMTQRVDQVRRRIAAIEKMIGINGADFQTTLEREIQRQAAMSPVQPTQATTEVSKPRGTTKPVNENEVANSARVSQALREASDNGANPPPAKPDEPPKTYAPREDTLPERINPPQHKPQPAPPPTPQQTSPIERVEFPDTELQVPNRDEAVRSDDYLGANQELTPTEDLIMQTAYEYGVDPKLVRAIAIAESDMNQDEISDVGAIGVMQLMPETAASLGVNPYNKSENIVGGTMYIREMLETFDGNVPLAVAAYNAGPGAVKRYGGIPPYSETQNYVGRVMDLFQ